MRTLSAFVVAAGLTLQEVTLSPDEGNLIAIARPGTAAARIDLNGNYEQIRTVFRAHTAARSYRSRVPYQRMIRKALRYVRESWALRKFCSAKQILDAQFRTWTPTVSKGTLAATTS